MSADLPGNTMEEQLGENEPCHESQSYRDEEEGEASFEDASHSDEEDGEETGEGEEAEYILDDYHQQSELQSNVETWMDHREGVSEGSGDESEQSILEDGEAARENFNEVTSQRPVRQDHVDFILDSIDAELSDIINRTEHDSKHVSSKKRSQQSYNQLGIEEGALDTGLGTGSPDESREASPKPSHQRRTSQLKKKGKRQKKPASDWSDTESIASIDVRSRVQEVLIRHGMDQNSNISPSVSGTESQNGDISEIKVHDEENVTLKSPKSEKNHSSNSRSRIRTKKKSRHKRKGSESEGMSHNSDNNSSVTLHDEYANEASEIGSDLESIATEDFESKFQQFVTCEGSRGSPRRGTTVESVKASFGQPPSRNSTGDLRKLALSQSINPRHSFVKANKKPPPPPQRKSGLPEYMYLKKEVTESDIGSDSIWTEDYEAQYWKAGLTKQKGIPVARHLRRSNFLDSDKESVQTEDYESHFNHLMVKQLAGVPVRYYDEVTIASDLDSFQSAEVQEKVQQFRSGRKPNSHPKARKGSRKLRHKHILTSTPYRPKHDAPFSETKHVTMERQNLFQEYNS